MSSKSTILYYMFQRTQFPDRSWRDMLDSEKRTHMQAKICPIPGPGKLSQSERARLAESGADTVEYFSKVVLQKSSNVIRRHLHPALKQMNYVNPHTATHKAGRHAFRRFRNTFLRNKTRCPERLRNYWMGHSGDTMDDLYDKIKEDVQSRKMWAQQVDSDSKCAQLYRMYRKT